MLRGASLEVNTECECTQAIRALTPLVRKLGPKANPANLKLLPPAAIAAWAFYIGKLPFRAIRTTLLLQRVAQQDDSCTVFLTWHKLLLSSRLHYCACMLSMLGCRLHWHCAIWHLLARQTSLCCGVAYAGGGLALQCQLLLCQPDPELAWRAHDPERSGEPVVTQPMLCHVFHADCTAAVCCDTTHISEECENQRRVQAEEEATGNDS